MKNQENWIVIACFGRPHGVKGFITVHSFTEPRDNVLKYTDWHAFINNKWQPIKLLRYEMQSKALIVQVEGYPERELVASLTNIEIAVRKEQLANLGPGEYYWHQLIGMHVINQQGTPFGKVIEILPTGANDVLVIQGEKRHLVPYLPGKFVLDVNTSLQIITIDWDMDF